MQSYLAGNPVTMTMALTDESGEVYSATAVEYSVLDGNGLVLVARTPLTTYVAGETEAVVEVGSTHNALSGVSPESRTVRLYVETATGTVLIEDHYRIAPETLLTIPDTSFQSVGSALLEASNMVNIEAFNSASTSDKIKALIQARHNIASLYFGVIHSDTWQTRVTLDDEVGDLNDYDSASFASLDEDFLRALKRAQVIEADFLLSYGSDSMQAKLDMGLTSETIGESSQTFANSKRPQRRVCQRAMALLAKYVTSATVRIGRA